MEKMTSRLAAAALVGSLAVLGAGCATNAATPAGGHPSAAAAGSAALPNPFTVLARYGVKPLGLDHPDALAIGPDGNLYVADLSQRVTVISPAGKVTRRWGKPGTAPGEFKFIAGDPTTPANVNGKITVGRNGMVYISDSGNAPPRHSVVAAPRPHAGHTGRCGAWTASHALPTPQERALHRGSLLKHGGIVQSSPHASF
jgi:hypothetical protein